MRLSRIAIFYIAGGLVAILAAAFLLFPAADVGEEAATDNAELTALLDGDMKKLAFHPAPRPVPDTPFLSAEGGEARLSDYAGRHVLVNFWATWCAPCRKEMPMLSQIQEEFGGARFEVVTIATGRNAPPAIKSFFEDIGVDNLPMHRDPTQELAREMGVLGLPITVILDPENREIARMLGDADWSGDSARALIAALISPPEGS